jgi:hypothetical protein
MSRCRSVEGLMAASLYEALDAHEQRALDAHLGSCAACRAQYAALQQAVAAIPNARPVLTGDLLPALREQLRRRPGRTRMIGWWGFATAAGAVAVAAAFIGYSIQTPEMVAPTRYETAAVASPLLEAMAQASDRMDRFDYHGAYQILRRAVTDYPDDASAGDAQMVLADLAYSQLYRFRDAYQDYESLRMNYYDTFAGDPQSTERWALLAEAQQTGFASLEALEAARRAGGDSFEQLEAVVARYPSHMVASLAADEMGRLMATELAATGDLPTDVLALERARERCMDPIAVARLTLELAGAYARDLNDGAQACSLLKEVQESGNSALARLADDTVARLGVDCGAF